MYDNVYNNKYGFVIPDEHIPSEDDMKKYQDGDPEIVSVLIEGLMAYIVNEVEWFLTRSEPARPYREDCLSEAMFALVDFVNKELGKEYTSAKFLAFAKAHCIHHIVDWLAQYSVTISIKPSTRRDVKIEFNKMRLEDTDIPQSDIFNQLWFDDFISDLDSFDRDLIQMKMDDMSNREIARTLGVHDQTVKRHLDRLERVYEGE